MADRGMQLCQDERGYFLWKRCEIEGCPNLICERRSPIFCWPHSDSGSTLGEIIEDARAKDATLPIEQRAEASEPCGDQLKQSIADTAAKAEE